MEVIKSKFQKSEWICWMVLLYVSYSDASVCAAVNLPSVLVNTSLSNGVFDIIHPGGLALCARECKYRQRCKTFNYKASTDECQLNQKTMGNLVAGDVSVGFSYSNINTWPKTIAGECADNPCTFHDRCRPNQNSYMCETIYFDVIRENDTALIGYVFDTLTVFSEHECAAACYYRSACVSFNLKSTTNTCELNRETMTTDYLSYIGNMPGSLYSNLNQSNPDNTVGVCLYQPCNHNQVCDDDAGQYICNVGYCLPPNLPLDVHVIPEFDQSVSLWGIDSHLKYRCSPGYYPAVNWTCSVDGDWLEPQCTAITTCQELFSKCEYDTGVHYIFKYPGTDQDIITKCNSTRPDINYLRLTSPETTYSYYSTEYTPSCHLNVNRCGYRNFSAVAMKWETDNFQSLNYLYESFSTDCDGRGAYRGGANCNPSCTNNVEQGRFQVDLRVSGIKFSSNIEVDSGSFQFTDNDQLFRATCYNCTVCGTSSPIILLPANDPEIDYTNATRPICQSSK